MTILSNEDVIASFVQASGVFRLIRHDATTGNVLMLKTMNTFQYRTSSFGTNYFAGGKLSGGSS